MYHPTRLALAVLFLLPTLAFGQEPTRIRLAGSESGRDFQIELTLTIASGGLSVERRLTYADTPQSPIVQSGSARVERRSAERVDLRAVSGGIAGAVTPQTLPADWHLRWNPWTGRCSSRAPLRADGEVVRTAPTLRLVPVASGLSSPVDLTHAGDERLFVVEQSGRIRLIKAGQLVDTPFLDIESRVRSGGEQGLLGLAFHPDYAQNGRFFVDYTWKQSGLFKPTFTVIAEYQVDPQNPDRALTQERVLLKIRQPASNHNGGQLRFGPDGFLYVGMGDGGGAGDPGGNGQNTDSLLAAMLRIDVDAAGVDYGIPADNPFAQGGGRPELFAWGLRNPWRFSFDRETGRLFAGDVGQEEWEEIHIVGLGDNCGWSAKEGFEDYGGSSAQGTLSPPIAAYDHSQGQSVTGGFVYRGQQIPGLVGTYVFADFVQGRLWGLREGAPGVWQKLDLGVDSSVVSAFGEDVDGELYVISLMGSVSRLAP